MQINVNLGAIRHNFAVIKARSEAAKICAMVKADAYGHGICAVAKALNGLADCFGVANDTEAERLRAASVTAPILIAGGLNPCGVKSLFEKNIIQAVTSVEELKLLEHIGIVLQKKVKVHIKVDTGMNRLGVNNMGDFEQILDFLAACKHIICEGIFTHFAVSDGSDPDFLQFQHARFQTFLMRQKNKSGVDLCVHCLSSGGILTAPEYAYNMVRAGLLLYGYAPDRKLEKNLEIKPALTATAPVVAVKNVDEGESISYGRTYFASSPKKIAVIRAGYGDGYKRILSNRGRVIISGRSVPVVGRVCMDMFMADVTDIPVKTGDQATLLGEGVSAHDLADAADTIPYEILTSLKPRTEINYISP